MARTFTRSGGLDQVTPDTSLVRRFKLPCSWDRPVSETPKKHQRTLMSPSGRGRTIFSDIQIELVLAGDSPLARQAGALVDPTTPLPYLRYAGRKLHSVTVAGLDLKQSMRGTSLFTATKKMNCPSFSLTAGTTGEGGTCASANPSVARKLREEGKIYICDGCYSLEGYYVAPSVAASQAARQAWVMQEIAVDPTGEGLGLKMAAAIFDYANSATLRGSRGGLGVRLTQEIGIWNEGMIWVPAELPQLEIIDKTPCRPTKNTLKFFNDQNIPNGAAAGFFRIHDSGDFTPSRKPDTWAPYLQSWLSVARHLPHVQFWAPTRIYINDGLREQITDQLPSLPNLQVRPSALHVDDLAPNVTGLANGTTVASAQGSHNFSRTTDESGRKCHLCPAYLLKDSVKSCMSAGCRVCWLYPQVPVAYGWH